MFQRVRFKNLTYFEKTISKINDDYILNLYKKKKRNIKGFQCALFKYALKWPHDISQCHETKFHLKAGNQMHAFKLHLAKQALTIMLVRVDSFRIYCKENIMTNIVVNYVVFLRLACVVPCTCFANYWLTLGLWEDVCLSWSLVYNWFSRVVDHLIILGISSPILITLFLQNFQK